MSQRDNTCFPGYGAYENSFLYDESQVSNQQNTTLDNNSYFSVSEEPLFLEKIENTSSNQPDPTTWFSYQDTNLPHSEVLPTQNNYNLVSASALLSHQRMLHEKLVPNSMPFIVHGQIYNPANNQSLHVPQHQTGAWLTIPRITKNTIFRADQFLSAPADENERKKLLKRKSASEKAWLPEDDSYLLDYVVRFRNDWKKILREFKKHNKKVTVAYLKLRYKAIKNDPFELRVRFTHLEDMTIAKYINQFGKKWEKIAEFFPNRTPIMIKNRYYSYIKKRNILSSLCEETQEKSTNSDMIESVNTDGSTHESVLSAPHFKLINMENEEQEDMLTLYSGIAPEDQLNEKVTPFLDLSYSPFDSEFDLCSMPPPLNSMPDEKQAAQPKGISIIFDRDEDIEFYDIPLHNNSTVSQKYSQKP